MTRHSDLSLEADPRRVLARLFIPGHEQFVDTESRATGVLSRILSLDEEVVCSTLADVMTRYAHRHRDFPAVLAASFAQIVHRIPDGPQLSPERKALLGAWFTHEYSIEAAALFNPSIVAHPDQAGLPPGDLRVLLSLRAVGEGHLSSVEFRSGVWSVDDVLTLDDPGPHVEEGSIDAAPYDRELLAARLFEEGADAESARFLLSRLSAEFRDDDLEAALTGLRGQQVTRHGAARTEELARYIVSCTYRVTFSEDSALCERVLWAHAPSESHGLEDARFVQFHDDGADRYLATYTAYDGTKIAPQVIETADFRSFLISPLAGPAAKNKGMALFPRRVGGRYAALSRWDRENCSVTFSDDGRRWEEAVTVYVPHQPWELIQTGNCGSPLETEAGWLVLTHGVGPMREYAIGALLLDLEDPTKLLGSLAEPLLRPVGADREGYVPNVVYSCGGMIRGETLLLPYGVSDAAVRFAFFDVPALVGQLLADGPPATIRANRSA